MMYQLKVLFLLTFGFFSAIHSGTSATVQSRSLVTVSAACPLPDVTYTGIKNGAFSFDIKGSGNTVQYYYIRLSDNSISSIMTAGSGNLEVPVSTPGLYRFCFRTVCGNEVSEFVIDDLYI
jgi:hypothetical protein